MSTPILIIGGSGTGKSRSLLNLIPEQSFIIASLMKDLPFRGWKKKYTPLRKDGGNYLVSDDYETISKTLHYISEKRPEIKQVIIDDAQYLMVNEFMRRHSVAGAGNAVFSLYNDIADHFWKLCFDARLYRQDLLVFIFAHNEVDDNGNSKMKTIGKLLDEKINAEGMFSIVLNTEVEDGKYHFATQNNGSNTTKSPEGMFANKKIENDLAIVAAAITEYNEG